MFVNVTIRFNPTLAKKKKVKVLKKVGGGLSLCCLIDRHIRMLVLF